MARRAIVADLDRCTGCLTCVVACKEENHLPAGMSFIPFVRWDLGDFPEVSMYYLPVACQQCDRPACAASCPEGAIARHGETSGRVGTSRVPPAAAPPWKVAPTEPSSWTPAGTNIARKCELCAATVPVGARRHAWPRVPARHSEIVDADIEQTEAVAPGEARSVYALGCVRA